MKNKLWLLQIPFVVLFTFAFYVDELGVQGRLNSAFLREHVHPSLRRISTVFTDWKFKFRGPQKPKNKVLIVSVDSQSIERIGRWPWHRDYISLLISSIFDAGAKAVALDMVFSEPDQRVPDKIAEVLRSQGMEQLVLANETDRFLEGTFARHNDELVTGWTSDLSCQPAYDEKDFCDLAHPDAIASHPVGFEKFSYSQFNSSVPFEHLKTPFPSFVTMISNLPDYNAVTKHSGYFNVQPDPDSYIRRMNLFFMVNGKPYPSLALELARVGMKEDLRLELDEEQKVKALGFAKSGRMIPVSPVGVMEINFRGKGNTFAHISALDLIAEGETTEGDVVTGNYAGMLKKEVFKDAYVFVGVTALGVFDMRAIPYDSNIAGVEVHANILDNLLSGDTLTNTAMSKGTIWVVVLMVLGGLLWAYVTARLEAIPALALFLVGIGAFGWLDLNLLFNNGKNWNTSFLYLELVSIFAFTLSMKYVMEERNKKFIRGAFTKYVAPAVVDSILKDPSKLTVGGEKRELTILFSDIRGFTSFSEKMDAKALSSLLNEYLGVMTKIIFAHEGTLDKYIGDAIMAFWGAPLDQPKHAANSLKTAIAMMKALNEQRPLIQEKYGVQIEIGIGINSGMVSVGNMGSETNFAYTVIGDHVNLASRLESLTKAYGVTILTTRFTLNDVLQAGEPLPPHRVLDHVKVKVQKNAVEMIQVLDREYDSEGLKMFEEGRALYTAQKWDEAITVFTAANARLALSVDKMDGPCAVYLERCGDFKKVPPEAGWDGSWEMHSK